MDKSNKVNKQIALQVLIVFLVLVIIVLGVLYFYNNVSRVKPTFVGGFNWTENSITVEIGNNSVGVEPGEMFSIQLQENGEKVLRVRAADDSIIRENIYNIGDQTSVILELVSSENENECIAAANLSNYYYDINDGPQITETNILSDSSIESFIYKFNNDPDVEYLVYPGNYDSGFLPEEINENEEVTGFFFVNCNNIEDQNDLKSDILGSIYYGEE